MVELFAMEYMTALGMTMVLLFLDSKYPRWVTALAVYVVMVLVMGAVAVLYCTAGLAVTVRAYTLLAHAPSLLLLLFFSRFRGWRMLFQLMSAILFCMLTQHAAGLVYYLSGQRFWVMALSYAVLTVAVICFLVRFLRPLFFQTLEGLRHGWWLACLAMALYYGIVVYVIPGYVGLDQVTPVLKPAVSLLMVGFYMVLMLLFTSTRKEMEAQHGKRLVEAQAAALRSRLEALGAAEEETRLMRHDMRHRFQTVAELVGRGEDQRALAFIGAAQRKLDEGKPVRWCGLAVLDAVFASYFGQAQRQGVRVEADIRLQEPPPGGRGGAGHRVRQRFGERPPRLPEAAGGQAVGRLQGHLLPQAHVPGGEPLGGGSPPGRGGTPGGRAGGPRPGGALHRRLLPEVRRPVPVHPGGGGVFPAGDFVGKLPKTEAGCRMTCSLPFCEAMRRSQRYFPYWSTSSRTRLMRRTEEPGTTWSATPST